jgi:FkbH-like protein
VLAHRSRARVVQHTFALRPDVALGNLAAQLPGSRHLMLQALNLRLGKAAQGRVALVDCDRLAGMFGKARWFDDRYWARAKQAVALDAVPLLARQTAAVVAAAAGLSRKCLVLDLDNTLWGGIIGEDELSGIRLGGDAIGEGFIRLQDYLVQLKRKGVVLAVASKNNEADAREVFERHPDMRLRLDDLAVFLANWDDKPSNLRRIADRLNIGLDALVLLDDNPAERQLVRDVLPEVDIIQLPEDPSRYARALADYPWFETAALTDEDRRRTEQYRARAKIAELEASSEEVESFYRSLGMHARMGPFDELRLPRITQLVNKTNQFNLTTRRYEETELRRFADRDDYATLWLELRDRFTDHGLVAVLIARQEGDTLDIDTFLMSCRVIGRTVESALLARLCWEARSRGCTRLRGTYVASAKNAVVGELYPRLGFRPMGEQDGSRMWTYDLERDGMILNEYIIEDDACG